jgi:hypothetical protein
MRRIFDAGLGVHYLGMSVETLLDVYGHHHPAFSGEGGEGYRPPGVSDVTARGLMLPWTRTARRFTSAEIPCYQPRPC